MTYSRLLAAVPIVLLSCWPASTRAAFTTFAGNATQEAAWQAAVGGTIPIENFDSFLGIGAPGGSSDTISSLPALHITFDGPPYPGVYSDGSLAHSGANQWANFGGGAGNGSNHVLRVQAGYGIRALGFWNCDPQGNQPMAAYDFNNQLVGTIVGEINNYGTPAAESTSFAGFISTVPIKYLFITGSLGDGWNHIDDLQVVAKPQQAGDFDFDGDVDGADFVIWQTHFPTATGAALGDGDADSDGDVDGADFVIWQTNFPTSPQPGAMVPEPGAIMLAALAACALAAFHRHNARVRHSR